MNKKVLLFVAPVFFLAGLTFGVYYFSANDVAPEKSLQSAFAFPVKKGLSDFSFKDQNGEPFTKKNLKKHWSLLFFGFTHCPDICPTTLSTLSSAYAELPEAIKTDLQVILVSVDPERDSVEKMAEYIRFFNKDFIALSTHHKDLIKLTQSLGVSFIKRPLKGGADYTVDHTSRLFLIDKSGRRAAMFSPQAGTINAFSSDVIRDDLVTLIEQDHSMGVATRQ